MNVVKKLFTLIAASLPLIALAQEASSKAPQRPELGQHYGLSDEVWLWLFMGTAVIFTMIILTINSAIRNLAESKNLWKPKTTASVIVLLLVSSNLVAQGDASPEPRFILSDSAFWAMAGANAFLMMYALLQLRLLRNVTRKVAGIQDTEPVYQEETGPSWWAKFWLKINDLKSQDEEKEILLNHNYDGIQELDNNLPPWWKWTFYLSIIFGVIYLMHYHVLKTGPLQKEEFQMRIAKAEEEVAAFKALAKLNIDETNVTFVLDEERLRGGAGVYIQHCAICHGQKGEGGVGPNLTDHYWLHGGTISDVFRTIKYGVPAKGMQAWNTNLSAIQIQNVSTYILALQGTDPPNQKEAQGEFVEPPVPQSEEDDEIQEGEDGEPENAPAEGEDAPENGQLTADAID